jgi:hypothetical protein
MNATDFSQNVYLILLRLVSCSLDHVPAAHLPNLQVLDLSDNVIVTVDGRVVARLRSLKSLVLAGNPIHSIMANPLQSPSYEFSLNHELLEHLDLSRTNVRVFPNATSALGNVQHLNLSFTKVRAINSADLRSTLRLAVLDLRGCDITDFPLDVFQNLNTVKVVYVPDYHMCCDQRFFQRKDGSCVSPSRNTISTCEHLLRSRLYQLGLAAICIVAVVGNAWCILSLKCHRGHREATAVTVVHQNPDDRNQTGRDEQREPGTLSIHLSVANSLTGAYCGTIAVADEIFRGVYILYEKEWTRGAACAAAGVLFLLSTHAAAFTTVLVVLDRCLQCFRRRG